MEYAVSRGQEDVPALPGVFLYHLIFPFDERPKRTEDALHFQSQSST